MTGYLLLADGRVVPVHDGIVIGRVAGCDCVIDDAKASRRHARVVVENGVVEIEDLESSNGTLLNGKPVTRRLLRPGDQVQIGKTVLTYKDGVPPGAARPAASAGAAALDADNDLFGDDAPVAAPARPASPPSVPTPSAQAPLPPPRTAPQPPAAQPIDVPVAKPTPPPTPIAPPPVAAARPSVVEFADEVVEVRKAPPDTKKAASMPASAGPIVASGSRVLQFAKHSGGGGGMLGDDLTQMSGATRSLVYAGVLLLAVGIVFGIVYLVR